MFDARFPSLGVGPGMVVNVAPVWKVLFSILPRPNIITFAFQGVAGDEYLAEPWDIICANSSVPYSASALSLLLYNPRPLELQCGSSS